MSAPVTASSKRPESGLQKISGMGIRSIERQSWNPLRGLNSRPSVYKTTRQWRHASVPKLLAVPAHAAEGAGGQSGAGHPGQLGSIPITPTIHTPALSSLLEP